MNLRLKTGQLIVLIAGLLLFINLFLPWYQGFGIFYFHAFSAGFLAWFGSFCAIAAAVLIALKVFARMRIQAGPLHAEHLAFVLGALGLLFIFIRLVSAVHFTSIGVWFGLILSGALVAGTVLAMREEGLGFQSFAALGGTGTPPPPPPPPQD